MSSSEEDQKHGFINYGDAQYWDKRYTKSSGQRFDWLQSYQTLKSQIESLLHFDKSACILNIGCGNGQLQDHLYEAGYENIINNDISPVVIEQMTKVKEDKGYHKMKYEIMDVRKMAYGNESFDMVIDKSTIDALLCSTHPIMAVVEMLAEVYRVLKDGGVYFMVSYGTPATRMEHLQRKHIHFQIVKQKLCKKNQTGEILTHYLYICKKQPGVQLSIQQKEIFLKQMIELEQAQYK